MVTQCQSRTLLVERGGEGDPAFSLRGAIALRDFYRQRILRTYNVKVTAVYEVRVRMHVMSSCSISFGVRTEIYQVYPLCGRGITKRMLLPEAFHRPSVVHFSL